MPYRVNSCFDSRWNLPIRSAFVAPARACHDSVICDAPDRLPTPDPAGELGLSGDRRTTPAPSDRATPSGRRDPAPPGRPAPRPAIANPTRWRARSADRPPRGHPAARGHRRIGLADVVARFAAGTGPVAVDAERASGYRYSQRAYLVQLRRAGAGTALIDPMPLADLSTLDEAIADAEWVLHAASQDLACLAEVGLRPRRLFDTELAARLAGFERVGLAALTEQLLGLHAGEAPLGGGLVDPAAARVLADLRGAGRGAAGRPARRARRRAGRGRASRSGRPRSSPRWSPAARRPPRPRPDPWRRTSGIHRVRGRAGAGPGPRPLVRPGRRSPPGGTPRPAGCCPTPPSSPPPSCDPKDERTLLTLPGFGGRSVRRLARTWLDALDEARAAARRRSCRSTPPVEGPPPPHRWAERDPVAAGPAGPLPGGGDRHRRRAHPARRRT